jgi:hypothetical protein
MASEPAFILAAGYVATRSLDAGHVFEAAGAIPTPGGYPFSLGAKAAADRD